MKGFARIAPLLVLASASGCASTARPQPMPAWSPETVELVAATAPMDIDPMDIDDDEIRVPREVETPDIWPASGLYLGGAVITSQPMGDFDGDTSYFRNGGIVIIPDIDVGAGAGVYLSYRWHMNELMLQYSITEHDGDFSGTGQDHDTTFYDLDVNWRHYFLEKSPLQPYGLLGLGWGRATIDNGTTDQAMTQIDDAEVEDGINVNVGAGVALYTLPWVVFYGQGMYRFVRYESIDGIGGNASATPDVDGDGWNISFGAALRVLRGRN